jgi:polyisoprenoid-binding protein YceI
MKTRHLLIVIATALIIQSSYVMAQSFKVKNYKMTVKGESSLHDWESVVQKLECKGSYKIENNILTDIKETVVKITVESIKSPKGRIMDNKTYDAFNYEKYPQITFTLNSKKIDSSNLTADLKGTLAMAGYSRPIDIQISYKIFGNGDLQIIGSKKLKMTDFKMEPPTAMMGTVKVGDEVTVSFDIVLSATNTIL